MYIFDSKTLRSITSFKLSSFRPDGFPYSTMATLPFWFSRCGGGPFFSVPCVFRRHCPPSTLQHSRYVARKVQLCQVFPGEESGALGLRTLLQRNSRDGWWRRKSGDQTNKKTHTGYIDLYSRYMIKEILPQMAFIFEFRNLKFWGDYMRRLKESWV